MYPELNERDCLQIWNVPAKYLISIHGQQTRGGLQMEANNFFTVKEPVCYKKLHKVSDFGRILCRLRK